MHTFDGGAPVGDETLTVTTRIDAAPETVFGVLADPTTHEAIDGTGWVLGSHDGEPIRQAGQVFRVRMYHANHPDGHYDIANRVEVFDAPRTICWQPGQDTDVPGELSFGGWTWRYDLTPVDGGATEVALTYDWSAVPPYVREYLSFPPFPVSHLENSLAHLAELATR